MRESRKKCPKSLFGDFNEARAITFGHKKYISEQIHVSLFHKDSETLVRGQKGSFFLTTGCGCFFVTREKFFFPSDAVFIAQVASHLNGTFTI